MIESWRWFGPDDPVPLSEIRQAGASGVVTALHGVPAGTPWTRSAVEARRDEIREAGLDWVVVESIPVHEDIKTGAPGWEVHADAWAESLRAVAAAASGPSATTSCRYSTGPVRVSYARKPIPRHLHRDG